MKKAIFFILLSVFFTLNCAKAEWLNGWKYRVPIKINVGYQNGYNLTDFQIKIKNIDFAEGMNWDLSDIRFTDSDGVTILPYFIERRLVSYNDVPVIINITDPYYTLSINYYPPDKFPETNIKYSYDGCGWWGSCIPNASKYSYLYLKYNVRIYGKIVKAYFETNCLLDYYVIVNNNTFYVSAYEGWRRTTDITQYLKEGWNEIKYACHYAGWIHFYWEMGINGIEIDSTRNYSTKFDTWVKVPLLIENSTKTIYMYYGNPNAKYEGKMWDNVSFYNYYGGVFDYDIFKMAHRIGVSRDDNTYNKDIFLTVKGYLGGTCDGCVMRMAGPGSGYCASWECYPQLDVSRGEVLYSKSGSIQHLTLTGQIGYGDWWPYADYVLAIESGPDHKCFMFQNRNISCIRLSDEVWEYTYPNNNALMMSAEGEHLCVLTFDGNIYCQGNILFNYTGHDAIFVSTSYDDKGCFMVRNGSIYCWGGAYSNIIEEPKKLFGKNFMCFLTKSNDVYCPSIKFNYTNHDVKDSDAGSTKLCILKKDKNVYCFNLTDFSVKKEYDNSNGEKVCVGNYHACVLTSNNNVYCWGWGTDYGQIINYLKNDAKDIYCGPYSTCIVTDNNNAYCWGKKAINFTSNNVLKVSGEPPFALLNNGTVFNGTHLKYVVGDATDISCYGSSCCVLRKGNITYCWGIGSYYRPDALNVLRYDDGVCVLRNIGDIECYGDYDNDFIKRGNVIGFSIGRSQNCFVTLYGDLYCNNKIVEKGKGNALAVDSDIGYNFLYLKDPYGDYVPADGIYSMFRKWAFTKPEYRTEYVCGNGVCEPGEDVSNCPQDCPGYCGDGICNPYYENVSNCPQDCGEAVNFLVNILTNPFFYLLMVSILVPGYISYKVGEKWGAVPGGIVFFIGFFTIMLSYTIYYSEMQYFLLISILIASILVAIIILKMIGGK